MYDTHEKSAISLLRVVVFSVILGASLMGAAYLVGYALQRFSGQNRSITVRGIGERDIRATQGAWTIQFTVSGTALGDTMENYKQSIQKIQTFLQDQGFSEKEIWVGSPTVSTEGGNSDAAHQAPRLRVTGKVSLKSDDVEKIEKTYSRISLLFENGVMLSGWDQAPAYSIKNFDALRPELLEDATRSAHAAAGRVARTSGLKLGGLTTLSQGIFTIKDKDMANDESYGSPRTYNQVVRVVVTAVYKIK